MEFIDIIIYIYRKNEIVVYDDLNNCCILIFISLFKPIQ